jgi:hypothetical protein
MAISSPYERRAATRRPNPPCPYCAATAVNVTVRTVYVYYLRCEACGEVWHVPKPGFEAPGWRATREVEPGRGAKP